MIFSSRDFQFTGLYYGNSIIGISITIYIVHLYSTAENNQSINGVHLSIYLLFLYDWKLELAWLSWGRQSIRRLNLSLSFIQPIPLSNPFTLIWLRLNRDHYGEELFWLLRVRIVHNDDSKRDLGWLFWLIRATIADRWLTSVTSREKFQKTFIAL